jgi:hypothetical protein
MPTYDQKEAWLNRHEFAVREIEENDEGSWQAWDTIDSNGFRVVCPTREEAIDEAFNHLFDTEEHTIDPIWENNNIQFARLLSEIYSTQEIDFDVLSESMDLSHDDITDLFNRAETEWQNIKNAKF